MSANTPLVKHVAGLVALVLCLSGAYFIPNDRLAMCVAFLAVGGLVTFLNLMRMRDGGRLRMGQVKTVEIVRQIREKQSKKEAEILRAISQVSQEDAVLKAAVDEILETVRAQEMAEEARRQADRQKLGDRQREDSAAEERRAQEALGELLSVILSGQEQIKHELSRISRGQRDGGAND